MQIKGSHKNIYKLYKYARTQESLDVYRKIPASSKSLGKTWV